MSNEKQKKKKGFKKFRALVILILIIVVLLLLDGRFGLGPGGDSLFSNSGKSSSEREKESPASRLIIEIRESEIFYKNQAITFEALKTELENNKEENAYVLKDAMANYGVFSQVEQLLKDLSLVYAIE